MNHQTNKALNLTLGGLRSILKYAHDDAGHHILWVDTEGEAHMAGPFTSAERADWLAANNKRIAFRAETFCAGNGYCGPEAANDDGHVRALFRDLDDAWRSWNPMNMNHVIGSP